MLTISGYTLRQILGPVMAAVIIALLVLLTERLLRLLDLVLDSGGGLTILLQMLAFLVPHYMALALPAAFFLGLLIAFSRMHQRHELDALGSAGIGLPRLVVPVLILAVLLTVLSAVNVAVGQPYARYIYRALVHDVAQAAANVYLQERTFMEVNGITFMAERVWRDSKDFSRVFIFEEEPDGKTIATTAEHGSLRRAAPDQGSILFLRDGVRLEDRAVQDVNPGDATTDYGALTFSQLQKPIDLVGKEGFRPRGEDERELTLLELWRYQDMPPPGVSTEEMLAELHVRLVRTVSVLFLPFLALPFALGFRRARQFYGVAVGLLVLVIYNQSLNVGETLTAKGQVSHLIGLWLPFASFGVLSIVLFYRSAFIVPLGRRPRWHPAALLEGMTGGLRGGRGVTRQRSLK